MNRAPHDVFQHHRGPDRPDFDETVAGNAGDAVLLTRAGSRHGKDGVRLASCRLRELAMCLLPIRSAATCKRSGLSLAWRSTRWRRGRR